jgi:dTMP kinase
VSQGLFVTLEGIDGSGTTTQAQRLVETLRLRGARASFTCEPTDHAIGKLLRQVLRGEVSCDPATVALLFAADRLEHVRNDILPRCSAGEHVIADRYVHSSLAYQSVDLPLAWVAELNRRAPAANLTIYLRVAPEVASARRQQRGEPDELYDALESQRRIAAGYDELLGTTPGQLVDRHLADRVDRVAVLDGEADQETVATNIWQLLAAELSRSE